MIRLNCTSCGAPISIPDDVTQLTCANCGTQLYLEHGEGYYTLKGAEKISEAIRQSSDATVKEMRRTQLIQSRDLAESKIMKSRQDQVDQAGKPWTQFTESIMEQLIFQEWCHAEEYRRLQGELDTLDGPELEKNDLALQAQIDWIDHSIMILKQLTKKSIYYDLIDGMVEERALYQEYLANLDKGT